jgi:hypothetical protein
MCVIPPSWLWWKRSIFLLIALMKETVHISETSIYFKETTWWYMGENFYLHARRRENLKSRFPNRLSCCWERMQRVSMQFTSLPSLLVVYFNIILQYSPTPSHLKYIRWNFLTKVLFSLLAHPTSYAFWFSECGKTDWQTIHYKLKSYSLCRKPG